MEKKSTIPERRIPCEFCNEEIAILYCRADSAKLCLFCDFHVHSANDLSRKHVRSQICDNCSSQPVSVRCGTDNLVLCQDCDWDSHGNCSVSANHERNPVEGFSGCPTPMELASIWGFDLGEKKAVLPVSPVMQENNGGFENWSSIDSLLGFDNWGDGGGYKHGEMSLQDLMVPNECANENLVPCAEIPAPSKWQNPSCGKHKKVIFKQLIELVMRDQIRGGGDGGDAGGGSGGEDLGPETPSRSAKQGSNEEGLDLQNGVQGVVDSNQVLPQQAPFTQLLMSTNLRGDNDLIVEEDALWGCNPPTNESRQIWDFNLGRSRDHEPPNQLEVGYDTTDTGFMMQSYSDLINGTPMVPTKMLEDTYELKCSSTNKEFESATRNSKRAKTSEANNLTIQPSSSSSLAKGVSNVQDVHLLEQSLLVISETTDATTRANMELLAQNRGNAMLRYKEKKKTRRYDKHIRYESRKARADTRKRVKGRFVKASEAPDVKITG